MNLLPDHAVDELGSEGKLRLEAHIERTNKVGSLKKKLDCLLESYLEKVQGMPEQEYLDYRKSREDEFSKVLVELEGPLSELAEGDRVGLKYLGQFFFSLTKELEEASRFHAFVKQIFDPQWGQDNELADWLKRDKADSAFGVWLWTGPLLRCDPHVIGKMHPRDYTTYVAKGGEEYKGAADALHNTRHYPAKCRYTACEVAGINYLATLRFSNAVVLHAFAKRSVFATWPRFTSQGQVNSPLTYFGDWLAVIGK